MKIVIEIQGGCLSAVYCDEPEDLQVMLVDRDAIEQGDPMPKDFNFEADYFADMPVDIQRVVR